MEKLFYIITVRNEVAKVMFLQACVCPRGGWGVGGAWSQGGCLVPGRSALGGCLVSGGTWFQGCLVLGVCSREGSALGGWGVPGPRGSPPRGFVSEHALRQTPLSGDPPGRDSYCCGQYASYWNAFLLVRHFKAETRLHSSRMCTARLLTVSQYALRGVFPEGVSQHALGRHPPPR